MSYDDVGPGGLTFARSGVFPGYPLPHSLTSGAWTDRFAKQLVEKGSDYRLEPRALRFLGS